MSLETIASRLTGYVTNLPKSEAYNIVNDAWTDVRNDRLWSFQLGEDGVASPNVVSNGTITATTGSATVTCNSVASAALNGLTNPLITQRQFRVQGYSIYNIVAFNTSNPTACVITLDRPFIDPGGAGLSYLCYQAYYPAPVKDFKRWLDWRDMTNGQWLSIYKTRREANMVDPQRLYYSFPYWVLSFQTDQRANSATPGWMLYELYPNPLSVVSYMRWWIRTYPDLVNPSDTLPDPITDKLLLARARVLAYQWAEGNKDPNTARGAGADYKTLIGVAGDEYGRELKLIGLKDRDRVDLFLSRIPKGLRNGIRKEDYYSSLIGRSYGM